MTPKLTYPVFLLSTMVKSMKKFLLFSASLALVLLFHPPATADSDPTVSELDAVWAELSRTVLEGDFEGMAAVYHEDAVLVNAISQSSYPIATAMVGWKPDIERTRVGDVQASVAFRFSQRLHDATTAHETGMFYYSATPKGGETSEAIINFDALLVKKNGEWKMMMEYQKSAATADEWNALDN
jgi:uncharacterized protein (TIGR02246 family)